MIFGPTPWWWKNVGFRVLGFFGYVDAKHGWYLVTTREVTTGSRAWKNSYMGI